MKKSLYLLIVFLAQFAFADQAYIKIGEARAKKSNMAFPHFNNQGSNNSGASTGAAAEIYTAAVKDLEMSTYFQMISNAAFLEDPTKTGIKPQPGLANGFKFEPLKTIGAEFLIRGGYEMIGNELTLEMFLYQVSESKLLMGKRYKAPAKQGKQIGHTLANDVLEALTGVKGPFLSKIVTTSDRGEKGIKEVFTMNRDGTEIEKLSNHHSIAVSANWSNDAKKIAYSVFTKFIKKDGSAMSNVSLYVLDLATGKRVLTSYRPGQNSGAAFSPDGKSIYLGMSMGSGAADIYRINISGEVITRLTKGPAGAINVEPTLSPDGQKIAFSSERGGRPMIYVMNSDGGGIKRLTFDGVYNSSPSWSPDGKKIAFAGQDNDHFDIFVMNADGSNIVRVTTAKKANGKAAHNEDPSFSPDSRFVVYTSNRTGKNQIFISTVDGAEERRVTNDSYNYYKPKWSKNIE